MTNKEQIVKWVLEKKNIKLYYGSIVVNIIKDLGISKEEVYDTLTDLVKLGELDIVYILKCNCGYRREYKSINDIDNVCNFCDSKIDIEKDVYIDFKFKY